MYPDNERETLTAYLDHVLFGRGDTPPQANYPEYDSLYSLFEARQKATHWKVWESVKRLNPELYKLVGVPALDPKEEMPPLDMEFLKECIQLQETGDANMLERLHHDRLRYDHETEKWYIWRGNFWQEDKIGIVKKVLSGHIRAQYFGVAARLAGNAANADEAAEKMLYENLIEACQSRARAVCNIGKKKRVLEEAQTNLAMQGRAWDNIPNLLACPNGTIDLRTGQLRPGRPSDYLRTVSPTTYTGLETPAPRFERFIAEIFDHNQEMVCFMQRLLGYGITGLSTEHKLPIFYGEEGRNGKDTLLETLSTVLGGGLASTGSQDLLIAGKSAAVGSASPHLMDLQGARLKWVSETAEGASLNANQVKQLTGGGKIKARPLHGQMIEFAPTHLLLMLTNHKPRIPSGGDAALWARLLLIPFLMRFVENPSKPNERPRDPYLKVKLAEEASGILAWLVRGAMQYHQEGLNPPDSVLAATDTYQNEEDLFSQFIEQDCLIGPHYTIGSTSLYEAFRESTGSFMSQTKFGRKMAQKGIDKVRANSGMIYQGIGLKISE